MERVQPQLLNIFTMLKEHLFCMGCLFLEAVHKLNKSKWWSSRCEPNVCELVLLAQERIKRKRELDPTSSEQSWKKSKTHCSKESSPSCHHWAQIDIFKLQGIWMVWAVGMIYAPTSKTHPSFLIQLLRYLCHCFPLLYLEERATWFD